MPYSILYTLVLTYLLRARTGKHTYIYIMTIQTHSFSRYSTAKVAKRGTEKELALYYVRRSRVDLEMFPDIYRTALRVTSPVIAATT